MSKTYFYFNLPGTQGLPERELALLDASGHTIDLRRVIIERVPHSHPCAERPELVALLRRMKAADALVVTQLGFLGASVRDLLATLERCTQKALRVHCEAIGQANLAAGTASVAMRTLIAVAELEKQSASARTREHVAQARVSGQPLGRPPSLSRTQCEAVLTRLGRGATVSELAREFETSRQTIMRIRNNAPQFKLR